MNNGLYIQIGENSFSLAGFLLMIFILFLYEI